MAKVGKTCLLGSSMGRKSEVMKNYRLWSEGTAFASHFDSETLTETRKTTGGGETDPVGRPVWKFWIEQNS